MEWGGAQTFHSGNDQVSSDLYTGSEKYSFEFQYDNIIRSAKGEVGVIFSGRL